MPLPSTAGMIRLVRCPTMPAAVLLALAAALPQEPPAPRSSRDGLEFASADGAWSLEVHGKLQMDFARFDADRSLRRAAGEFRDSGEVRRSRLDLSGRALGELGWRVSADFRQDSGAELRDVYLETAVPGAGTLRAGHFKQPFSLENRTSSSTFAFFERSVANELAPGRDAGLMLFDGWGDGRGTWAAGAFHETHSDAFGVDSADTRDRSLTGRLTWLPVDEDDGARLVHLGAALSHRDPDPAGVSFSERAEAHLGQKLVSASYPADRVEQLGLEAAAVFGSTSAQMEWNQTWLAGGGGPSPTLTGGYLQLSQLLTGEVRGYKRKEGVFGRIEPRSPLSRDDGLGAWELAARVSRLDLAAGDRLDVWSLALNWHWTERVKLQLGFLRGDAAGAGAVDTWMFRLHLDW